MIYSVHYIAYSLCPFKNSTKPARVTFKDYNLTLDRSLAFAFQLTPAGVTDAVRRCYLFVMSV